MKKNNKIFNKYKRLPAEHSILKESLNFYFYPKQAAESSGKLPNKFGQTSGQTLIETVVAAFILTMGISAAVALAVYAFGTSSNVVKQIIATGLAREGIEAVKNMRDTNWLQQVPVDTNCYNFASPSAMDAKCYKNWLAQKYCINPTNNSGNCDGTGTSQNFNLSFDSSSANFWILNRMWPVSNKQYGLLYDPTNSQGKGMYYNNGSTECVNSPGMSIYCRKITITKNSNPPYDQSDLGPELQVTSQVWWTDKKCPRSKDYPGSGKCSVEIKTYLTNWKNY